MPIITPTKTCTQKVKLLNFLESSQWTDCTFIVGTEKIGCHKIILASSSPVFEAMLFGSMASSEILISDINADDFRQMLKFIYSGDIELTSVTNAWAVVYIVKKYLIDDLLDICRDYIQYHIDCNNVLMSYECAELYSEFDLQEKCMCAISQYPQAVFLSSSDFHIKPSTFSRLLEIDNLNIIERDLINVTIKWAKMECTNRQIETTKDNLRELLLNYGIFNKLRFSSIPTVEYSDVICEILTENEISLITNWQRTMGKEDLQRLEQCNINSKSKARNAVFNYLSTKFRKVYKAANVLLITEPISVKTGLISSKRAILMGLVLSIERYRHNETNKEEYTENFDFEIFNEANKSILKLTVNNIVNYHSFIVVDFQGSVILEENCNYDIVISWNSVTPPFMLYATHILEPTLKTKNVEISFTESDYSIIQGLSIF